MPYVRYRYKLRQTPFIAVPHLILAPEFWPRRNSISLVRRSVRRPSVSRRHRLVLNDDLGADTAWRYALSNYPQPARSARAGLFGGEGPQRQSGVRWRRETAARIAPPELPYEVRSRLSGIRHELAKRPGCDTCVELCAYYVTSVVARHFGYMHGVLEREYRVILKLTSQFQAWTDFEDWREC